MNYKEALQEVGLEGITVIETKGFGRQKGPTELYPGAEYVVDCLPKVEIVLGDHMVDKAVDTITRRRAVLLGATIPEVEALFFIFERPSASG